MNDPVKDLIKKFGSRLIGKDKVKRLVCETLLLFPPKVVDLVSRNCWIVSSFDDAWGFALRGDEIGRKYLIFLSDELFDEPINQQRYTIAHEISHVALGHKNSILENQTKAETAKQEKEAHLFALNYLKPS